MRRRWSILTTTFCLVLLLATFSSSTFSKSSQETFRKITDAYVGYALINSRPLIIKPDPKLPVTFWTSCLSKISSRCSKPNIRDKISKSIANNQNVNLKFSEFDPTILVVFADQYVVDFKRAELNKKYTNQFQDSADLDCALYYNLDKFVISKVVILVSLDASDLKQRLCLANHFFQGIGLSLPNQRPFSELWQSGTTPLSKMSVVEFDRLVGSFSILTYLHFCSTILNGMDREAVEFELKNGKCLQSLYEK